jgi:hypothetical protein
MIVHAPDLSFVSVICDYCGKIELQIAGHSTPTNTQLADLGWRADEVGQFCPDCVDIDEIA